MFWMMAMSLAMAGYGDAVDGYPTWAERDMHLWTSAARVDPEAFEPEYNAGGCSFYEDFSVEEQTPKAPVMWNLDLNKAARFHSQDMYDNGCFAHESCDGTSFEARLQRFYDGNGFGENIASGYPNVYAAVFEGWMCSTHGHRENIMYPAWEELGTGAVGTLHTQDFGMNGVVARRLAMGVHEPELPVGIATFWSTYAHPTGNAPDSLTVVLDGKAHEMVLAYGVEASGIYRADVEVETACHSYYFSVEVDGAEERFPETGSYAWGDCMYDDTGAGFIEGQEAPGGCGCASGGLVGGGIAWPLALLGLAWRRRWWTRVSRL
ncbi:MAG: hypothetical protein JXX28_13925 [Deltaproteobacteria bacterium]|nr:hypothetical protein [Deltaproteobacteria bacterium]